jgi:hypothetical protein
MSRLLCRTETLHAAFRETLDEGKNKRRTVADAVEVLCKHGNFRECDHAIIRVDPLPLPSCEPIAQVHAVFDGLIDNLTYFVWLPSSGKCKGRRERLPGLEVLDIFELSGGIIHFDGSVMLQNGTLFRAVEVIPALLPHELSDLDWCILHKTIAFMGSGTAFTDPTGKEWMVVSKRDCRIVGA